jgi:cytochrome c-type biogenesis protein CcmH
MSDSPPAAPEAGPEAIAASPTAPASGAAAKPNRWGLIALGVAAAFALGAVVLKVSSGSSGTPPLPEASGQAQQQPSVDDVIARLEAKLKDNPEDAESWRMLGWSYFQTERFAEAATALKRATTLDPKNAETFSFLGEALVMASKEEGRMPRDARLAFEKALALDPKDARARYFRAAAMDLDGRHKAAIDAWFELMEDTPADAPYAEDVKAVIIEVAKKNNIDIAKRLAETKFAPPASGLKTRGSDVAAAGIPGPSQEEMKAASQLPSGQQEAMIRGMVDKLDTRLKANPADADGWIMLMRSRMQLGEPAKAQKALADGLAAFRNDTAITRQLREAAATLGVPGG